MLSSSDDHHSTRRAGQDTVGGVEQPRVNACGSGANGAGKQLLEWSSHGDKTSPHIRN